MAAIVVAVFAAFVYPVMGLCFALAIWTGISAGRYRPTGEIQMVVAIVVEAALLAQSIVAWVVMSGSDVAEPVTFVAYSIGILAPMPVGFQLARLERTRWGSVCVCFAAVVVGVMTLRLADIWGMLGG